MSRKKIVAGNWKMNSTLKEAKDLVSAIVKNKPLNQKSTCIIFPPFVYLPELIKLFGKEISFGAQNCSSFKKGAYTGEVSAEMLADICCEYVLIGHSERRSYFNETSEQLIDKIKLALQHKLKVIFCFGELLKDREANTQFNVVEEQLLSVLKKLNEKELKQITLAYEPVWAIGTGLTATPNQAEEMHFFIRTSLQNNFGAEYANSVQILYGGSCNATNAEELFSCPNVDGGLIGGASLKGNDFVSIIKASL